MAAGRWLWPPPPEGETQALSSATDGAGEDVSLVMTGREDKRRKRLTEIEKERKRNTVAAFSGETVERRTKNT